MVLLTTATVLSFLTAALAAPNTPTAYTFTSTCSQPDFSGKELNAYSAGFWLDRDAYPYCSIRMNPRDCLRPDVTGIVFESGSTAKLSAIMDEKLYVHPTTYALSFARGGVEGADPGHPMPQGGITTGFKLRSVGGNNFVFEHAQGGKGFWACPTLVGDVVFQQVFVDYKGKLNKEKCVNFEAVGQKTDAKAIVYV